MNFPGFNSYRARYLLIATLLSGLLLLSALVGYFEVRSSSRAVISRIQDRSEASLILADVLTHLTRLESRVQDLILSPSPTRKNRIHHNQQLLITGLEQLVQSHWNERDAETRGLVREVLDDSHELQKVVTRLLVIRSNEHQWFPATRTMQQRMLPEMQTALSLLDQMRREATDELSAEEQIRVLPLITLVRDAWLNMASEIRLYVANRFGVFSSDTQTAMQARLHNIATHADAIPGALAKLRELERQQVLGFSASINLPLLVLAREHWLAALGDLVTQLSRPDWRYDLAYLDTEIRPLLDRMGDRMSALQLDLDIQSAHDTTDLTDSALWLSRALLVVAGLVILLTFISYGFFSRMVLRPIAETAHALKDAAMGRRDTVPPRTDLAETRDLIDAFHEMTEQVRNRETRLDHIAHHDALTHLPNRILFNDRLEHALRMAERRHRLVALMFLDLDRFKQINDTLGHSVGDGLLIGVAKRLQHVVRGSDTVARLGGDEFAIIAEGITDRNQITTLAEKVLAAFDHPFAVDQHELHGRTSIGIALCPDDSCNPDELVRAADTAMYEAKRRGRGNFQYFSAEMSRRALEQMTLENALRRALEQAQFEIYYQPIVHLTSTRLLGFESLLRWNHPEQGVLTPAHFLNTLEESGLIIPVSRWLVEQTIAMMVRLERIEDAPRVVTINLSARMLKDKRFYNFLSDRISAGHLPAKRLVVEITEDALDDERSDVGQVLKELKTRGTRIAIDNFGKGRSSLDNLRRFPFDLVKIDREFVKDVADDPDDRNLVQAIIQLTHAFGMEAVAEGVETEAQLEFLRAQGCDYYQGHLLGRPMPLGEIEGFIAGFSRADATTGG